MPKTTNYDFLTFFYCVIAGVALSLLCDLLRALRKYLKFGAAASFIADLLFFFVAALLTFFMQFVYSNGQLRWYILGGELAGFAAARAAISPFSNKLARIINRVLRIFIKPIRMLIGKAKKLIGTVFGIFGKNIRKIEKNFLKCAAVMMYNIKCIFKKNPDKRHRPKKTAKEKKANGKIKARRKAT